MPKNPEASKIGTKVPAEGTETKVPADSQPKEKMKRSEFDLMLELVVDIMASMSEASIKLSPAVLDKFFEYIETWLAFYKHEAAKQSAKQQVADVPKD